MILDTPAQRPCANNQFECANGDCANKAFVCDGDNDCPDRSDENGCDRCPTDTFRCGDGACIRRKYKCDGLFDCHDASDETDCGAQAEPLVQVTTVAEPQELTTTPAENATEPVTGIHSYLNCYLCR